MKTYFLSDLHLTPERPMISAAFLAFLSTAAPSADKIYLLGDLFEFWIGDDAAPLLGAEPILQAMHDASKQCDCYFIAGNRDFLVGDEFVEKSGFKLLADETVIDLYGQATLLLHGDSLCTDDLPHQAFRSAMVTNQVWREQFLSLGIAERIEQAKQARMQSHEHKAQISMEIMDVTEQAVLDCFEKYQVTQMIHGHTHRQKVHTYSSGDQQLTRHVLGDWDATSSILTATADSMDISNQPISDN